MRAAWHSAAQHSKSIQITMLRIRSNSHELLVATMLRLYRFFTAQHSTAKAYRQLCLEHV
jgi:hypothetical protein